MNRTYEDRLNSRSGAVDVHESRHSLPQAVFPLMSEMLDEGWVDDPWEYTYYVYDSIHGWMADDGVADDKYRLFGGYHARLWQMSDGDVVANAHHDDSAINWPPLHQADEYEPAEDLVAGFYDGGGWTVYAGNYWLDNEYTNEHGAYNDGWTTRIYET